MKSAILLALLLVTFVMFQCTSDVEADPAPFWGRRRRRVSIRVRFGSYRRRTWPAGCTPGCACVHQIGCPCCGYGKKPRSSLHRTVFYCVIFFALHSIEFYSMLFFALCWFVIFCIGSFLWSYNIWNKKAGVLYNIIQRTFGRNFTYDTGRFILRKYL